MSIWENKTSFLALPGSSEEILRHWHRKMPVGDHGQGLGRCLKGKGIRWMVPGPFCPARTLTALPLLFIHRSCQEELSILWPHAKAHICWEWVSNRDRTVNYGVWYKEDTKEKVFSLYSKVILEKSPYFDVQTDAAKTKTKWNEWLKFLWISILRAGQGLTIVQGLISGAFLCLKREKKKKYLLWELIPVPFQKKSETQGTSNQSEYNKASSLELGIFLLLSIDHRFIHPLMHYSCSQSDSPECFLDAK